MLILAILVLGLGAGWAAQLLVGKGKRSWGQLMLIGLGGSLVGGLIGGWLSGHLLRLSLSGIIGSVVGSIIVLLVLQAVEGRSRSAQR